MADDLSISDYLGVGAAAAAIVVVLGGIGLLVDDAAGTVPVFISVGLLIGIAAATGFVWSRFRGSLSGPGRTDERDGPTTDSTTRTTGT